MAGRRKRTPTAIVADDDAQVRGIVARMLEERGYRVVEAPDGEYALYAARWSRPKLIVSDNQMPDMTGSEMIARFREEAFGEPPFVIMFSGAEEGEAAPEGVDVLIPKNEQGLACLAEALDRLSA